MTNLLGQLDSRWRTAFATGLPLGLLWLILYQQGFPVAFEDDLFYVGAALNLVQEGDFANPLLSRWAPQMAERFFVYPPFHSYASLAGCP